MALNGVPTVTVLRNETVWLEANKIHEAETRYHELQALGRKKNSHALGKTTNTPSVVPTNDLKTNKYEAISGKPLSAEIAEVRLRLQQYMKADSPIEDLMCRIRTLENEKKQMKETLDTMEKKLEEVYKILSLLEVKMMEANKGQTQQASESLQKKELETANGPEDDIDLFGSDEETEEDIKIKEERLKAYANKKAKKPAIVAKSSVILDVKPWSDETDMKELEIGVRNIESDGLKWGAGKLVPLAYGIKKLQIIAIVEDDKVSIDWLQETIEEIEDLVQSVDIAAFNKL